MWQYALSQSCGHNLIGSAERQVCALHVIIQERGRASTLAGLVLLKESSSWWGGNTLQFLSLKQHLQRIYRQGSESGSWNLAVVSKHSLSNKSFGFDISLPIRAKVLQRLQPCPWPTKIFWITQLFITHPPKTSPESQRAASRDRNYRNYRFLSVPQFEDSPTIETAETGSGSPSTYARHIFSIKFNSMCGSCTLGTTVPKSNC